MTVFFGIFSTLNLVSRYFCCQLNARHMPNWNAKRILEHVIDIIQCLVSTVPHNRALLMSAHEFCNIGSDNGIFQGIEIRLACRKTFRWILYPPLFSVLATHADLYSPIRNHLYVSTQILLYGWDPRIVGLGLVYTRFRENLASLERLSKQNLHCSLQEIPHSNGYPNGCLECDNRMDAHDKHPQDPRNRDEIGGLDCQIHSWCSLFPP